MKEYLVYILLFVFNLSIIPLFSTILKKIESTFSGKK